MRRESNIFESLSSMKYYIKMKALKVFTSPKFNYIITDSPCYVKAF